MFHQAQTLVAEGSFLLRLGDVTILLDCPLDLRALSVFVPQYRTVTFPIQTPLDAERPAGSAAAASGDVLVVLNGRHRIFGPLQLCPPRLDLLDVAAIDVVLISNPTGILGLPYLVRRPGFRARIFATEPTAELGRYVSHAAGARGRGEGLADSLVRPLIDRSRPLTTGKRWWRWSGWPPAARPSCFGRRGAPWRSPAAVTARCRRRWATRTGGSRRTRKPRRKRSCA